MNVLVSQIMELLLVLFVPTTLSADKAVHFVEDLCLHLQAYQGHIHTTHGISRYKQGKILTRLKFPLATCSHFIMSTIRGRVASLSSTVSGSRDGQSMHWPNTTAVTVPLCLTREISRNGPIRLGIKFPFLSPSLCHKTTTCFPTVSRMSPNLCKDST